MGAVGVFTEEEVRAFLEQTVHEAPMANALLVRVLIQRGWLTQHDQQRILSILEEPAEVQHLSPFFLSEIPATSSQMLLSAIYRHNKEMSPALQDRWLAALNRVERRGSADPFAHMIARRLHKRILTSTDQKGRKGDDH